MLSFNQDTDDFRPKNRVIQIQDVDIVKTLPVKIIMFSNKKLFFITFIPFKKIHSKNL